MLKQPLFWLLLSSALVISMLSRNFINQREELFQYSEDLPEIISLVNDAYVDQVDMGKLMPGVFQGAIEAADINASYIAPGMETEPYWTEVYQKWGMVIVRETGYIKVIAVAPDSPATQVGIEKGHFLRRIASASTRQMNVYQARRTLATWRGPLTLTAVDPSSGDEQELTLEAKPFLLPKAALHLHGEDILRISLPCFYPGWAQEVEELLQPKLGPQSKIMLDLRQNALGEEADLLALAALFFKKGEILQWHGAHTAPISLLNPSDGTFSQQTLFLLIDPSTCWAAELFAGAAQANGQATLVGSPTLGLVMGYQFLPLKNGGYLHFSLKNAGLGNGQMITHKGLKPDWDLTQTPSASDEDFLKKAIEHLSRAELTRKAS